MAHLKNYTAASVPQILAHNSRADNYSNPDIDPARSKYNYSLSGHENDLAYYKDRLSQVHHMKRANLNTLSSWVITLPKGIKREDQQRFFSECKSFLDERYGEKNCVSADVHFDETTPHLHYTFIPVVFDEKKKREKVSRRDLFTLKELYGFHGDLEKHIEKALGYPVGIKTGKTEKNVSINELKTKTKAQIIADAQQIANKYITDAVKEASSIRSKAEEEKRNAELFFAEKRQAAHVYEFSYQEYSEANREIEKLKNKKGILGYVSFKRDTALKLLEAAPALYAIDRTMEYVDQRTDELQCNSHKVFMLENENRILKEQNHRQQKILEEHGLVKQPEWKRKLGKGRGKGI